MHITTPVRHLSLNILAVFLICFMKLWLLMSKPLYPDNINWINSFQMVVVWSSNKILAKAILILPQCSTAHRAEMRWALYTLNLVRATFICFSSFIFLLFIFHCWLDCIFYGIVSFCIQMMNQFHRESWKSVWIIWKYCKVLNFHEKLLNSELKWHEGIGGYLLPSPLEKYILCLIVHWC